MYHRTRKTSGRLVPPVWLAGGVSRERVEVCRCFTKLAFRPLDHWHFILGIQGDYNALLSPVRAFVIREPSIVATMKGVRIDGWPDVQYRRRQKDPQLELDIFVCASS